MAVAIRRSSVDLPAPFGPRTSTDSPRSTRRSTRTRAGVTPNRRVTPERTTAGDPVRSSCSGRRESTLLDVPGEATRPQRYRRPGGRGPAATTLGGAGGSVGAATLSIPLPRLEGGGGGSGPDARQRTGRRGGGGEPRPHYAPTPPGGPGPG